MNDSTEIATCQLCKTLHLREFSVPWDAVGKGLMELHFIIEHPEMWKVVEAEQERVMRESLINVVRQDA